MRRFEIFVVVLGRFACYLAVLAAAWFGAFTYLSGTCSEGAGPRPDTLTCSDGLWSGSLMLLAGSFVVLEVWLWRRREGSRR